HRVGSTRITDRHLEAVGKEFRLHRHGGWGRRARGVLGCRPFPGPQAFAAGSGLAVDGGNALVPRPDGFWNQDANFRPHRDETTSGRAALEGVLLASRQFAPGSWHASFAPAG